MNVLSVTGVLAADPVRRDTTKGVVCEFRLAVDSRPRLWIVVRPGDSSPVDARSTSRLGAMWP